MEGIQVSEPIVEPVVPVVPNPPPPSETAHLLADLHKEKQARKDLEDKLKTKETDDLKKSQQWQTLAELKEKENAELKEQLSTRDKAILSDRKHSAIKDAAIKAGIRKEALSDLELIDLDGVQVESTSTGRINVIGAELAVDRLKTLRPHWFGGNAPQVNLNGPGVVTSGALSLADLPKLEKDAKQSGDYTKYHAAVMQIKQAK
jgi:hypothetical protein